MKRLLITGATGKVGEVFVKRLLDNPRYKDFTIRTLCHNRKIDKHERIEVFEGSIENKEVVQKSLKDITHVLHLATSKESPDTVIDVAIKGLFWLLEGCRTSAPRRRFLTSRHE